MKLLVVEDHQPLVANLFNYFEPRGYELDAAPDGLVGLHLTVTQRYDAILLDWMLPRMEGPSMLKTMRERGIDTPVLMLTARDQLPDKIAGASSEILQGIATAAEKESAAAQARLTESVVEQAKPLSVKIQYATLLPIAMAALVF